MGARTQRLRRAVHVARVARRGKLLRALREIGVVGERPATREAAREFRLALEELGTTYIKLGQLLSSRSDLLPDVYIEELSSLVDDVPPVPFGDIERVLHSELDRDLFVRVDPQPLASASVAQIHRGQLANGAEVAIKVRRPGIEETVERDLDLIRATARLLDKRSERAQLLQVEALADELDIHLRAELNLEEEAHNTELIARFVEDDPNLVVPRVMRPYVTERVLVLELIEGEKVSAVHGLEPERAEALARDLFRFYVRQVTLEGVYHADPHRGNVLLTPDGRLALLDFGLLGRLDDDTRSSLALLLIAVAKNRAEDVADLKRISLRYGIRLPPAFALVGKTLSQADSVARMLYPNLDPIALLESEALDLMLEEAERRLEPRALLSYGYTQLDALARLPRRIAQTVDRLEAGTIKVGVVPTDLVGIERVLRSVANRIGAALIVVGLLVSSALMARVSHAVAF